MYKNEYRRFKRLKSKIKIFRGCLKDNQDGFSWSLNKKEAKNYKNMNYPGAGKIINGVIEKKDVIALFLDKGKREIICLPEKVKIIG